MFIEIYWPRTCTTEVQIAHFWSKSYTAH